MGWFRRLLQTIAYVTIFPLSKFIPADAEPIGLAKYLPAVGALIGMLLATCCIALQALSVPPLLSATIIVVLWLLVTGGLHFDGLMDTADGICSHQNLERTLEIMHDPRVGNFAVIVGICTIALKIAALSALITAVPEQMPLLLLLSPCFARLVETWAIGNYKYARESGKGKAWHESTLFPQDFFWAAVIPLVLLLTAVFKGHSSTLLLLFIGLTAASGFAVGAYLDKILKGHTGDTYGAVVELSETLPLVAFALAVSGSFCG